MAARILIIEDDPASLELLKYILTRAGHAISGAADGAEGFEAALAGDFDLVLCDLQLPEISGYDVVKRLRASPAWRPVPVIAVTAYSMPGDREAAIAAGFTEFVTKPIDPETFLQDVMRLLPAGSQSG